MLRFPDRRAAGRLLAQELECYAAEAPIIIALPRGGLPVAFEVASALDAPLDVWVVRKLGVPWDPELGMGAVAEGDYVHLSPDIVQQSGVSDAQLEELIEAKRREVEARVRLFRGKRSRPNLRGRTVILVDDGIATGGTVAAALGAMRREGARKIVLGVPVAAADSLERLAESADDVVCLIAPRELRAVGNWYRAFHQVDDVEALALLERARRGHVSRLGAEVT
jgi:putative phosphoribosyl transferase